MASEKLYSARDVKRIFAAVAIEPSQADDKSYYHGSPDSLSLVQELLTTRFRTKRMHGLGAFNCLPMEVIIQILLDLDMKTYLALRQTNRAVRVLLTKLSEYKLLTTVAFDVFDAVFEAGIASRVTLQQLYRLLCEHDCMICTTKESSDGLRFLDSRAPKSKPNIAKGVDAVDVYRRSLFDKLDAEDGKKRRRGGNVTLGSQDNTNNTTKKYKPDPLLEGFAKAASVGSSSAASFIKEDKSSAGRYLFLPTMTRCCRPCLEESPRLSVPAVSRLALAADMPQSEFSDALCKPVFAGDFRKRMAGHRAELGTVPQAAATGILVNAGFPPRRAKDVLLTSGYLMEFAWVDDIDSRHSFVVPMPFLGPKDKEVSNGYACKLCRIAMDKLYKNLTVTLEYTTPLYSTKSAFMEHFRNCRKVAKIQKRQTR